VHPRLPGFGVALIGIIFAIERRTRHPRVSLWVSLGLNALSTAALALVTVAVFLDRRETQSAREGVKRIAE
jgi:hypothetical protein